jgi:hypothetical protein
VVFVSGIEEKGGWRGRWGGCRDVRINKTVVGSSSILGTHSTFVCGPFWSLAIAFCLGVALLLSCYVF